MRRSLILLVLVAGCASTSPAPAAGAGLGRSTPEAQGLASAAILSFLEAADGIDAMNSLMILRRGKVIAEGWWTPYTAEAKHELYSLSKSFTSTAVGFAVAEGLLSLDDEVLKFFPADAPSANLKAMRVRDLLTMSAGHQDETPSAPDKISPASFLAHPVPHKPGTHFKYNTPATFMLAAIVEKVSGRGLVDFLQPRLFQPLGIEGPVWNKNAEGVALGGYGLRVRTEDIARFGQLYLQRGIWNGRSLLPASWVDLATSRQVSNGSNPKSDWEQGYGFQFWRCRHGAYRGDGAFGQYCIVLPEQEVVIAITSGLKDMQAVLNLVWTRLLPAFQEGSLPENPAALAALKAKLGMLQLKLPQGKSRSPAAAAVASRAYVFPANDAKLERLAWRPDPGGSGALLQLRQNGAERTIAVGQGSWTKGRGSFGAYVDEPAAASGAWTSDDTYVVRQCFSETPYIVTWTLRFSGDEVVCSTETQVGFGAVKRPVLTGKAE